MINPTKDKWLDVLQGREDPIDRETREAFAMRQYHDQRLEADLEPLNDPEREKRLRNLVEARFAASERIRSTASSTSSGPFSRWWMSWNLGWPSVGAAATAVVLGVLVVPIWFSQTSAPDDGRTPKTYSPDPSLKPQASTAQESKARALAFADEVRRALSPLEVPVNVKQKIAELEISAQIPKDKVNAARQALHPLGVKVPDNGALTLIVR